MKANFTNLRQKKIMDCKWIFTVKNNLDGTIGRLKARVVVEGYAQTYGIDYFETFSLVVKLNLVGVIISIIIYSDIIKVKWKQK